MTRKILSAAVLALCLLQGCTGYGPAGFTGGYQSVQLGEKLFRVSFSGNGFTNPERVQELALLRCADLTLQWGYKFFVITQSRDEAAYQGHVEHTIMMLDKAPGNMPSHDAEAIYGSLGPKYGLERKGAG